MARLGMARLFAITKPMTRGRSGAGVMSLGSLPLATVPRKPAMPKQISDSREVVPFYDTATDPIMFYDRACTALEQCTTLLGAWHINDSAAKVVKLAKLLEDNDLEVRAAEIRVRAAVKIGELSRDLDKAEPTFLGNQHAVPSQRGEATTKAKALADAGLSTSAAQRYEKLTGAPPGAVEEYLTACRERQTPATFEGLQRAVTVAVVALDPTRKLVPLYVHKPKRQQKQYLQINVDAPDTAFFEGVNAAAAKIEAIAKEQKTPAARALLKQTAQRVRDEIRRRS
jgi:hypothetical protein